MTDEQNSPSTWGGGWICPACGTTTRSKCVDFRTLFIKHNDDISDIDHGFISTTTIVSREDGKFECSVQTHTLESLKNVLLTIAQHIDIVDELLCNHRWYLDGIDDCELECNVHPRVSGPCAAGASDPSADTEQAWKKQKVENHS